MSSEAPLTWSPLQRSSASAEAGAAHRLLHLPSAGILLGSQAHLTGGFQLVMGVPHLLVGFGFTGKSHRSKGMRTEGMT